MQRAVMLKKSQQNVLVETKLVGVLNFERQSCKRTT
jgi:hypothetical protein